MGGEAPDRAYFCAHYESCLDEAIRREWKGWVCTGCPVRGTADVPPPGAELYDRSTAVPIAGREEQRRDRGVVAQLAALALVIIRRDGRGSQSTIERELRISPEIAADVITELRSVGRVRRFANHWEPL